jgi:hypothetical protein
MVEFGEVAPDEGRSRTMIRESELERVIEDGGKSPTKGR